MPNDDGRLGALSAPSSSFPQQGQVDWTSLSRIAVEFSVETLSRLSKAGVEGLTFYAALAMFRQLNMDSVGERRILDALKRTGVLSSKNNALWFGFGIKSIIRTLSETSQGLACIGICACLMDEFGADTAARILKELFALHNPPTELSPSLHQWHCLINSCGGLLATETFGLIVSELARKCGQDGQFKTFASSKPKHIANALKGLFEVSSGTTQQIQITGGADCHWLAAVSHWLLGLSVIVFDSSGDLVYRPNNPTTCSAQSPQVIIRIGSQEGDQTSVIQKRYSIPSGRQLILGAFGVIDSNMFEQDMLSHGRLEWSSCLYDAFGLRMRMLLSSLAYQTGACLGAIARLYEHLECDQDPNRSVFQSKAYESWQHFPSVASFGSGFLSHACDRFPELLTSEILVDTMRMKVLESPEAALRDYTNNMSSIRVQCGCRVCKSSDQWEGILQPTNEFCAVILIWTLCDLVRITSRFTFKDSSMVRPTLGGLERIYRDVHTGIRTKADYLKRKQGSSMMLFDPVGSLLDHGMHLGMSAFSDAKIIFNARCEAQNRPPNARTNFSAVYQNGICMVLRSLCEVSADPQIASSILIVPGLLEWNSHTYNEIYDSEDEIDATGAKWHSENAGMISVYDNLRDSSTKDLQAELLIAEGSIGDQSISCTWRIFSSKGSYYFGPRSIVYALTAAYSGRDCTGSVCGSLDGFESQLVNGEGTITKDVINMSTTAPGPLVRVLTQSPLAIWIALAQTKKEAGTDLLQSFGQQKELMVGTLLQGNQCIKCCVTNALNSKSFRTARADRRVQSVPACILTSV